MHEVLGLDVGGTSVKVARFRDGRTLAVGQSDPYSRPDAAGVAHAIGQAIARAGTHPVARVGLCVPGLVDPLRREITRSVNLPGLVGVSLDSLVRDALASVGVPGDALPPAVIVSDALAAAIDYQALVPTRPAGPDSPVPPRLLAISLGTGVGAAVLDGDRPLHVSGTSPGHLGQVDVNVADDDGSIPIGPDGGRGSLEAYLGVPALRVRFGDSVAAWFRRASLDDVPVRALVQVLRIAHAMYRPDAIALLGGVGLGLADSPLAAKLRPAVVEGLTSLARPRWSLGFALNAHHAASGAARVAAGIRDTK
jgi:predicted NBD/HSP70 family sugar kinase